MARKRKDPGQAPRRARRATMLIVLLCGAGVLAGRAVQLGAIEAEAWRARADDQHEQQLELPAARGTIYDRDGVPLAASREVYSIAIAPQEVANRDHLRGLLREQAGLNKAELKRVLDTKRRWVPLRGRFEPEVREALDGLDGVYFQKVQQRFYPHRGVGAELLGRVNLEGRALGGMELEFDSILAGRTGRAAARRSSSGRPIPGEMLRVSEPVPGRDVYLTIDQDLQEIADEALRRALEETRAAGGELVMTDPYTGEILAAVSRRSDGRRANWAGVTAPYEPGSTLKPFTVAALLEEGLAQLSDSVYAEQGSWTIAGRTLTDVHGYGWMTLAEALQKSSNIGIAKMGARLDRATQYAYLRRFGFGTYTGVRYPAESNGLLRRPASWSKQSPVSLAIGYEISVTALQMAMAYGTIANGGVLMAPRLVREVRSRSGRVEQTFDPLALRRVISTATADAVREVMVGVVEQGTGTAAALGPFSLAGKTGTARLAIDGRYVPGAYTATFAGFFPADDPQLVFVVKLDEPRGAYYGGTIAAPVTRATLEAALAAHNSPIDKRAVATQVDAGAVERVMRAALASAPAVAAVHDPDAVVLTLAPAAAPSAASSDSLVVVPDVTGMPLRDAVTRLHAAGVRVQVRGSGTVRETEPGAGRELPRGTIVRALAGDAR